jgi:hypothetical protein
VSSVAETKTLIKIVHEDILQEALELICQAKPGIEISKSYQDYYGHATTVDVGIRTKSMPRGLGLKFRGKNANEELKFVGDDYGVQKEYSELQKLIVSTYQVIAVRKALGQLNYTSSIVNQNSKGNVRLEAVRA